MASRLLELTERVSSLVANLASGSEASEESGDSFERLSLEVFEFQYQRIEPYQRLCDRAGKTPSAVRDWSEIPAVSARAFKRFRLFAGTDGDIARSFVSSGTSDPQSRSRSYFSEQGLRLMDLAIGTNAAERVFPDGRCCRILVLAPGPEESPDSIMSYGMGRIVEEFGLDGSGFFVSKKGADFESLLGSLKECAREDMPAAILGSSFGCLHFFEFLAERGVRLELPEKSRMLHAGGYKGKAREVTPRAFAGMAASALGLATERVINLLGMTELASQIYDISALRSGTYVASPGGPGVTPERLGLKEPPKWVRSLILDPRRLNDPQGCFSGGPEEKGVLRHFDLANIERPLVIQSEDLAVGIGRRSTQRQGAVTECRFHIIGRAEKAEPRGCSLSFEDLARSGAACSIDR